MTLPYRISFGLMLTGLVSFGLSPWLALQSIERASLENDNGRWPELIEQAGLAHYAGHVLAAMQDVKSHVESKHDPRAAKRVSRIGKDQVAKAAVKLSEPGGIRHLLCGELYRDLTEEMHIDSGCWALNGKLRWESLNRVRVVFKNPVTDWHSSLIMERKGLFSWQAVAVELPVDAILDSFAESVGLKLRQT
ncbi:MAG: hypothetical protein ACU83N_08735, partial [Gammaproteobacteria bacterium]